MKSIFTADRRDYVISCIENPIPASSGPIQFNVGLDTDFPWMWNGFYLGSVFSDTGTVPLNALTFNILDSNRNYLFSDFLPADTINYAVTSSNVSTGLNRNEIFNINPERPQPAGGSFIVYANNLSSFSNLYFEIVFTGYKMKADCLETKPPGRFDSARNIFRPYGGK